MDPPNATRGAVYPPPLALAPVQVIKHFAKTRGLEEGGPARLWQEVSGELLVFRLRIGGHGKMLIYIGGARRDRVIASIRSRDDIAVLATPDPFIGERGGGDESDGSAGTRGKGNSNFGAKRHTEETTDTGKISKKGEDMRGSG